MPQIANWPKTRAEAQAILQSHPNPPHDTTHTCKVCNDLFYCERHPQSHRVRSFCSRQCYYRHQDTNPGFQRYRQTDRGKAMRRRVMYKSQARPEAIARLAQYQRWQKLVLTLDRSQRPFDNTPWPTCTTDGCHNINSRRNFTKCTQCTWQAALKRAWRNAGKLCKGGCGKQVTRYQQLTCGNPECMKIYLRESPRHKAIRRKNHQRRRARERIAFVEDVEVMLHFQWQKGRCYHCNRKIDLTKSAPHPKSLTLDHLVPLALGGDHSYANTAASCWDCTCSIKGDRAIGEQLKLV